MLTELMTVIQSSHEIKKSVQVSTAGIIIKVFGRYIITCWLGVKPVECISAAWFVITANGIIKRRIARLRLKESIPVGTEHSPEAKTIGNEIKFLVDLELS